MKKTRFGKETRKLMFRLIPVSGVANPEAMDKHRSICATILPE